MIRTKILYICPNGYRGGAEKFVLDNIRLHMSSGTYLPVVLFFNDGPIVSEIKSLGVEVSVLPFKLRMSNPWSVLKTIFFIFNLLRKSNSKLVHSTMAYAHILAAPAAYMARVPEVWFQHGPVGNIWDKIGKVLPADKILFNSKFLQRQHSYVFGPNGISDEEVLPLGIKVNKDIKKSREDFLEGGVGNLLLWVGRITDGKGLHLAIEALGKLKKIDDIKMLVVGSTNRKEDEEYLEIIKKRISELGLGKKIIFVGSTDNVSQYYNISDVFIHTAIVPESFGLVVAEAFGHGNLVVASSQGGVPDLFVKEAQEFSYDSFSSNASELLAMAIVKAINYPNDKKETLKLAAMKHISENYSYQSMNHRIEKVYDEVLNN